MPVPVGLNVWSRLVEEVFPYLDQTVAPFDSLWFPDHVQYDGHKVAEGWSLLAAALARYPDKLGGHRAHPAHVDAGARDLQGCSLRDRRCVLRAAAPAHPARDGGRLGRDVSATGGGAALKQVIRV